MEVNDPKRAPAEGRLGPKRKRRKSMGWKATLLIALALLTLALVIAVPRYWTKEEPRKSLPLPTVASRVSSSLSLGEIGFKRMADEQRRRVVGTVRNNGTTTERNVRIVLDLWHMDELKNPANESIEIRVPEVPPGKDIYFMSELIPDNVGAWNLAKLTSGTE